MTTVIIGAGQAGLAVSHCLSTLGIEHVVFERGKVAQRWRSQSWDSLRLLTPNWMTRLPGRRYAGPDPDGFMAIPELITFFERYAASSRVPLVEDTPVRSVEYTGHFRVTTDKEVWSADAVVVATGYCGLPATPAGSQRLAPGVVQLAASDYRHPDQLPDGGVLVVGASASGTQIADEIQRAGRQVTLAAGRHTRLPRRYRGRDIFWWFDRLGVLSQPASAVHDIEASRRQPSLQLVGRTDHASLDLAVLHDIGVRLTGRLAGIDGSRVYLEDDLVATTAAADLKMADVRTRIDRYIETHGMRTGAPEAFRPTWPLAGAAPESLDLHAEGIASVIWATGYRRAYPWLRVPVLDPRGEIVHTGGITPVAGLYVVGLNFQRRRFSSFIAGVGSDAAEIAQQIAGRPAAVRVA